MRIELLYFDGCPSYEALLPRLRSLLSGEGIGDEVELRRVDSPAAAERESFLGSPSIRIDGVDIEPGAEGRADFGLKCRLYRTPDRTSGLPPTEWILAAVRRQPEARVGRRLGSAIGAHRAE